ncbi:beta-propeller domain-containing protein [Pontiella sulfatireligans]|uniref:Uncharacterized protein n=1 Tax=Pontiella sulfatireligans TaxID=2750658 RepID=A0A6C2USY2_9BACT|nr:hypothetical protein [Pontiella sulfatireligans]VGO23378.1 hypothetical protein SCARR_05485 [Pontiella sulfatireligans]
MKRPKSILSIIATLAVTSSAFAQCKVEGSVKHRFLRAGWQSGGVEVFDADGKSEWKVPCKDELSDAWALPDGGAVYSFSRRKQGEAGVIRIDKNQKVVWTHLVPAGRDNHSCQPLPHGGFLMGECAKDGLWMVELDKNGKEFKRVKVAEESPNYHHAFRQVRKSPAGTYVGAMMCENKTYEWDAGGKLLRTFPTGGFVAMRLPNGNTLTSGKGDLPVVEYDATGKVVWQLAKDDLPFHLNMVCGLQRLPNGNTVVSNVWHGKHTDKTAPMLYETTPGKKVVWKLYTPGGNMGNVQIMDVGGDVYAGTVLK